MRTNNPPLKKQQKSSKGGWWFLASVLALYGLLLITNPQYSQESLRQFINMFSQLLPALAFMLLILWLFNYWIKPEKIVKHLDKQTGKTGWALALVGGIISMGPMYLWYPLLHEFKLRGVNNALLSTFLYSRAIKIPLLPIMVIYFGVFYVSLFVLNILLFSILSGVLMEWLAPTENH